MEQRKTHQNIQDKKKTEEIHKAMENEKQTSRIVKSKGIGIGDNARFPTH